MELIQTRTLAECEEVIERGLTTFVEVGGALLEIRERGLYRQLYDNFDAYCRERWGWGIRRAEQYMQGAEITRELGPHPKHVSPQTDRAARELAPLRDEPERMREAWAEAVERSDGQPTAGTVREVVEEVRQRPEPVWDSSQIERRDQLGRGLAVIVNQHVDHALIDWARERGILTRVDRTSIWGNVFLLDEDGDRQTVIRNYRDHFLMHKPSLQARLGELEGKALACWCAPEPCHADVLLVEVNGDRDL